MNAGHVSPPSCQHGSNCNTKVRIKPFSDQTQQWKSPFTWDWLSRVLSLLQTSLPNVKSCLGWQMVTLSGSWLSTGEARIQVRTRGGSLQQWRRCSWKWNWKNSLLWNFRLGSAGKPNVCSHGWDMLNEDMYCWIPGNHQLGLWQEGWCLQRKKKITH